MKANALWVMVTWTPPHHPCEQNDAQTRLKTLPSCNFEYKSRLSGAVWLTVNRKPNMLRLVWSYGMRVTLTTFLINTFYVGGTHICEPSSNVFKLFTTFLQTVLKSCPIEWDPWCCNWDHILCATICAALWIFPIILQSEEGGGGVVVLSDDSSSLLIILIYKIIT